MQVIKCTKCMKDLEEGVRICPYCGYDQEGDPQPAHALRRNTILHGKYLIGNVIGQGGFGITYVGLDLALEMKVAVKEYYPSGIASRSGSISGDIQWGFGESTEQQQSRGIERFLKEAKKMAKLDAIPSVVRVRDTFAENGTAYIIMDYVEGVTLKSHLMENGVMEWNECRKLLLPIMDSLSVIHENGFIHRDISPDNIMIRPDGSAMLLDFGAAVDMSAHMGQASSAVVKHHFSAPEQYVDSAALGAWTDVYAMAATIYYCLTGKVLPDAPERAYQKLPIEFPDNTDIPAHVKSALVQALALDENERTRDMKEFRKKLEEARDDPKPVPEPAKKRTLRIALAVAAVAILAVIAAVAARMNRVYSYEYSDGDVMYYKSNFMTGKETIVDYEDNGNGIVWIWGDYSLKADVFSGRTDIIGVSFMLYNYAGIEEGAFSGCTNLKWVAIEDMGVEADIPENCFDGCESLRYMVSDGVSYTGDIPSDIEAFDIREYIEEAEALGYEELSWSNSIEMVYVDEDDVLYLMAEDTDTDEDIALLVYIPDDVTEYEVPDEADGAEVVYICDGAFDHASGMESLTLSEKVLYSYDLFIVFSEQCEVDTSDLSYGTVGDMWYTNCMFCYYNNLCDGVLRPDMNLMYAAAELAEEYADGYLDERPDGSSWSTALVAWDISWEDGYRYRKTAESSDEILEIFYERAEYIADERGNCDTGAFAYVTSDDTCYMVFLYIQTEAIPEISGLSNTGSGVKVEWDQIDGASGYIIYRKASGGSYSRLCKITSGSTLSYTDTSVSSGETYYYKMLAYSGSGSDVTKSQYSSAGSITYLSQGEITGLRNTTDGMKLSWEKVSGASGYYIYRKASGGTYSRIATVTKGSTTTYIDSESARTGTVYYYAVKPYASDGSTGSYISGNKVRLHTPTLSSVTNSSSKAMTVKWKTKSNITGYQIQYSLTSDFSDNNDAVKVTGESADSTKISGLSKGKTYYVRIRIYKTISGTDYYSDWSAVKKVKIND